MTTKAEHRVAAIEWTNSGTSKGSVWAPELALRDVLVGLTHAILALSADDPPDYVAAREGN